jgi:hypothetical protein
MLWTGESGVPIAVGGKYFSLSQATRLALGPTQSPAQWVLDSFDAGKAVRA